MRDQHRPSIGVTAPPRVLHDDRASDPLELDAERAHVSPPSVFTTFALTKRSDPTHEGDRSRVSAIKTAPPRAW
jgi:hypothetical protein